MVRKLLLGGLALVILVAIGLATWEPLLATRSAGPPPHRYDTRIARDHWGVPHVFGTTDADVAYGIGFAHAEDDFATISEVLAMTRGRLGAMKGADGAKTDYVVHLLGARETVDRDYLKQPADVRALLDAYAAGVNLYARRHPEEVPLAKLYPVDGRDVATGFVLRSPFFFGLDGVLGALSADKPLPAERAIPDALAPLVTPVGAGARENGSNAFAVAPTRSADGITRLVSNSHQPWRGGVAWYELVVHSKQGWDFAGATFPGAPYPLLGHNRTLGWTNTVNRPDLIDVYKLVTDGERYRYDGQWRTLEMHRVWLPVRFGPFVLPIPKTVARAVQGPVVVNRNGSFAIRYAGADQLRMVEQYYRITRARNWDEWQRAMALQGVPATNFIYADATGRIAYVYNAMFPNRRPGYDYAKVLPGDTSRDFMPGTVPYAAYPLNLNPRSGFLMNANNTPYQAAGQGSEIAPQNPLLGVETDMTNRGRRALELLGADGSISRADLARIKFDTGVSRQGWAGPWFADLMAVRDPKLAAARDLLRRWDWNFDGRGSADGLAVLLMKAGQAWHYKRETRLDPAHELAKAATFLTTHFGRLDVPLGTLLRIRQGNVDVAMDGGPDVLRAASLWDDAPDGRLVVKHGDSFVMFMEWPKAGPVRSWSIQPYGQAITRPASPHFADQVAPFAQHRLKPVLFDPRALTGHVERYYRP